MYLGVLCTGLLSSHTYHDCYLVPHTHNTLGLILKLNQFELLPNPLYTDENYIVLTVYCSVGIYCMLPVRAREIVGFAGSGPIFES